jgi:hypothetical protein
MHAGVSPPRSRLAAAPPRAPPTAFPVPPAGFHWRVSKEDNIAGISTACSMVSSCCKAKPKG